MSPPARDSIPLLPAPRGVRPPLVLVAALLLAISGCASRARPPVVRVVDGTAHPGRFVSPYEYEQFLRAERCSALGETACAVEAYERALLGAEEDPYVLARLAEAEEERGDAAAADRRLARAEALAPGSVAVALARSRIAERRGRAAEAVEACQRALARHPGSIAATERLARLLLANGRADEAAFVLSSASRQPHALAVLGLEVAIARRHRQAILSAARELSRGWAFEDERVRSLASAFAEGGDPGLAADLLAMLVVPTEGDRQHLLAFLARADRADDLDVALARVASGPLSLDAGFAELSASRPEQALERAEAALASAPDPRARRLRGEALIALGRSEEGMQELRLVPFGTSEARPARMALVSALRAAGRDREASQVLAELDRRDPL